MIKGEAIRDFTTWTTCSQADLLLEKIEKEEEQEMKIAQRGKAMIRLEK